MSNLIFFLVSLLALMFSLNKKSVFNPAEKMRKYLQIFFESSEKKFFLAA